MQEKKQSGFQTLEIIASISLLMIIATIVVPNFMSSWQKILMKQSAHRLENAFNSARVRAALYNKPVIVCPLINNECRDEWNTGWSIFLDYNDNKILDTTENHFKSYLGYKGIEINFRNKRYRYLKFTSRGTSNFTSLYICSKVNKQNHYKVVVNRSGRARIEKSAHHEYCQ